MVSFLYSHSVRCGQSTKIRCSNVCGNTLNCGKHSCTQVCHAGKCSPCQLTVQQGKYWNALCIFTLSYENKRVKKKQYQEASALFSLKKKQSLFLEYLKNGKYASITIYLNQNRNMTRKNPAKMSSMCLSRTGWWCWTLLAWEGWVVAS